MSIYLREAAKQYFDLRTDHGWVITKDVFAEEWDDDDASVAGTMGPWDTPDDIRGQLERKLAGLSVQAGFRSNAFDMYDDDGEHMARGHIVWRGDDDPEEDALFAPLHDFGTGCWGCTRITFRGKPTWGN